jgi:S-(hydroxymethyl)glutathione dehydrogenase / alcohol dehydrogenase
LLGKLSNLVHPQAGRHQSAQTAISAVRRGRVVTMVGVYGMPYDSFSLGQIFDKGIALRFGQAPAQKYIDELLTWVEQRKIRLDDIITHRLPLDRHRTGMKASTR